jgi:hypothetical protein
MNDAKIASNRQKTPKGVRLGGRGKGTPNKATLTAREGIAMLIDASVPKMAGWLDEIEREHGAMAALRAVNDLIEYAVPKLARTEVTGPDGGPLQVTVNRLG